MDFLWILNIYPYGLSIFYGYGFKILKTWILEWIWIWFQIHPDPLVAVEMGKIDINKT